MVDSIKNVLIRRDGLTEAEAEREVEELRDEFFNRLSDGDAPFDLMEQIGLEEDYLEELMF